MRSVRGSHRVKTVLASRASTSQRGYKKSKSPHSRNTPEKALYSDNKELVKAKLKLLNGLKHRESAEKILGVLKQKMNSGGTEKQKFLLPKFSSYAEREASISSHRDYFDKKRQIANRSVMTNLETSRT